MLITELQTELDKFVATAIDLGYTVNKPELFVDPVHGNKLAYYQHNTNKIVIDEHYVEHAEASEIINTVIHELAHAVAEQNNDTDKRIWHGQAWKDINAALGGDSERYHKGSYTKPVFKKKSMKDLFATKAKHPATRWERGTYNQWLARGYHVIKGQKGSLAVWDFVADEYETDTDGKTSNFGRASAVYFDNNQVEAN